MFEAIAIAVIFWATLIGAACFASCRVAANYDKETDRIFENESRKRAMTLRNPSQEC
jgi:hypothetical protein